MSLRKHFLNKLLVVLVALPGLAMAAPLYRMTWLPQDFTAAGLDGAGRVVGTAQGGAAVWSTGGTTYLASLLPGSEGLAINNGGSIVGRVGSDAFVYAGGAFSIFNVPPAYGIWATAINDAGQVAGFGAVGFSETYAFLYQSGAVTQLGSFGGTISVANAINASGHIAGFASRAGDGADWGDPRRTASVYRDGVQHDLGSLGGWFSEANDINDAGFVAGWSGLEDNFSERPFLFSPMDDRMIDLGTLGGVSGRANALNNAGLVVGLSGIGSVGGFDYHAFVYGADGGREGMLDLNALVGERGDWQLVNALDVNDAGQILAQACNGLGDCRAVRLDLVTAVPEPGTWAMLGTGLALLAWRARRRPRARLHRMAPALLIGPLAAPLAAAAAPATAPATAPVEAAQAAPGLFRVTFIPAELNARAINGKGHVAGSNGAAAVWDGATVRDYAALAPGSSAAAINGHGHLAGAYVDAAHVFSPAGLRNAGRGVLVGFNSASGLNDSGAVSGNAAFGVGERGRGFVVANGITRIIPTFGGTWGGSAAINRHGAVTGTASVTGDAIPVPHYLAYVYRDQIMRSLGTLGGKNSSAFDINDAGDVVGVADTGIVIDGASYLWQPFLYSDGVMYGLGALGGFGYGVANGLNNAASVVGSSSADTPDGPASHAFLYERGAMRDLNALSAMPAGWTLVDATDINDARQILALACRLEDCQYVRLDPPPCDC